MKKLVSILMCFCLILSTFTFVGITASAAEYTSGYYTYTVSEGKAEITDCKISISGTVTIPSTLGGYPVTSIGAYAFSFCSSITNVTIPNSVKTVGIGAFNYSSLRKITIPKSVKTIGGSAFYCCSSLTGVNITDIKAWCGIKFDGEYSNPLSHAGNLYLNGNLVKKLTIPSTVTSIGDYAFSGCKSLTSIKIPNSVKTIGNYAFSYCYSLKSVTIGSKVTTIGDAAFYDCESLTSIKIPNSVKTIGNSAFSGCYSLKSVTIGNKVTTIGDMAFSGCNLTRIKIPNSVKSIGYMAFYIRHYYSFISVTIPDTLTTVGERAFDYDSVKELKISEGSKKITSLMYSFKNIEKLVIPSTIKTIEADAFYNYLNLKSIYIPSTVTKIGKHAFGYYDNVDTFSDYDLIKGFTICGKKGSAAQTYAKNNGIKFNAHKYKWTTTKKATYFAKGTSSYKCTACGSVSKTKSISKLTLKKPTFKLTGAKGKFTVKYTKVSGATGFELKYKLGSGKYKTVKVNTKKTISKVINKLKKGKYTVQVRAYVKSGKKYAYSSWASAKKVTVK